MGQTYQNFHLLYFKKKINNLANLKNSSQRATFITLTLFVSNCLERITKMCSWVTIGEHFAVQWLGAGMKMIVLCRFSSLLVFCSYLCLFLVIRPRGPLSWRWVTEVELHRLHALFHDRIPSLVRRVDWVDVGLYVRRRRLLHSFLLGDCCHRKLGRKYFGPMLNLSRTEL